jgi:hypothetical protein
VVKRFVKSFSNHLLDSRRLWFCLLDQDPNNLKGIPASEQTPLSGFVWKDEMQRGPGLNHLYALGCSLVLWVSNSD